MQYTYHDPKPVEATELARLRQQKAQALENGQTLGQVMQAAFSKPSHTIATKHLSLPAIGQDVGAPKRVTPNREAAYALYKKKEKAKAEAEKRETMLWPQILDSTDGQTTAPNSW